MSSKCWPHTLKGNDATWPIVMAHANEPLSVIRYAKDVDDFGNGKHMKELWSNSFIIGRRNVDYPLIEGGGNVDFANMQEKHPDDPEGGALHLFRLTWPYIQMNPHVDGWEAFNEPIVEVKVNNIVDRMATIKNLQWLNRFTLKWMQLMESVGKKAVILNFNVGSPDIKQGDTWQWDQLTGCMKYADDHNHPVGLHEYSDNDPATERSVVLRYRDVISWYCTPHGLNKVCFVINEQGTNYWRDRGLQQQVPGWTIWYDQQTQLDPRLLAFFMFTCGAYGRWTGFDFGVEPNVVKPITAWIESQVNVVNPITPPAPVRAEGIDVSHFQGTVNWAEVAKTRKFAICKFSQGVVTDTTFEHNWSAIQAAGLVRGCYQFFVESMGGDVQARVLALRFPTWTEGDLPPILDVENPLNLPDTVLMESIQSWVTEIKDRLGVIPIIYTNQSTWNGHHLMSSMGCPLWVANYKTQTPRLPTAWNDWRLWQYDVLKKPAVAGVDADCDVDRFNGTLDEMKFWIKSLVLTPVPPSQPVLVTLKDGDRFVTTNGIFVRSTPGASTDSNIIGSVPIGTNGVAVRDSALLPLDPTDPMPRPKIWCKVVMSDPKQLYGYINTINTKKL